MASDSLVRNDSSENRYSEKLLSPELNKFQNTDNSDGPFDKFGEPEISSRIGYEYQAEIPALVGQSKYLFHSKTIADAENKAHLFQDFLIGLPIPLTSICVTRQDKLRDLNPVNVLKRESKSLSTSVKCDERGYALVPGLPLVHWTKSERDSFLLGLYVFEKDFVQIRLLVETKKMGSILSFYYNEFYGTQGYRRWSESRKTKSKKCVYGQRIFSGPRQQELLSRILPMVSEECQNALLEVSKTFRDEKMLLSDYVFSLKSMVGMEILVKAIGIGTGKQDLTGTTIKSSRHGQGGPTLPEAIPSGKACSSLTTTEIIKFISGGFRLSKARSNDLFWEAVWPRLLARGWHSEQPRHHQSYNISSLSHCLVFLVPGVKKFSRRKLVKGDHYFDSVSDVLSRVAQEPELIELENGNDGDDIKEESDRTSETNSNNDRPTSKQRSYLPPRTPQVSNGDLKFTIVDTALSSGKVIELRGLPCEVLLTFTAQHRINHKDMFDGSITNKSNNMFPGIKNHDINGSDQDVSTARSDVMVPLVSDSKITKKNKKNDLQENKKKRKITKPPLNQKQKMENVDQVASINERCKTLMAHGEKETENGMVHSLTTTKLQMGMSNLISNTREAGLPRDILASTDDSLEKNAQMQTSIDLNLTRFPTKSEKSVPSPEPSNDDQVNESSKQENSSTVQVTTTSELLSDLNPRRHGTRNRPPTARALEALADGYLTANKKRKVNETRSRTSHAPNEYSKSVVASQAAVENEKDDSSALDNCYVSPEAIDEAGSRQCIGDTSAQTNN